MSWMPAMQEPQARFFQACIVIALTVLGGVRGHAQWAGKAEQLKSVERTFGDPPGATRLDPVSRVWADSKNHRVIVDGYVALRSGQLEMLACLVGTKEHESIVAVFAKAQIVHAALLAVGAQQGKPVQWEPNYTPPTGSEIQVLALWRDAEGKKHHIDTRQWVREVGSEDKVLDTNFVFAGSILWQDPDSGEKQYMAEGGDLICVSNFTTATLDVPMKSSQVNSGLMFAAFTERIPELGAPIRLVLQVLNGGKPRPAAPESTSRAEPAKERFKLPSLDELQESPK
ncbi:MAG: hypothetical protein KDA45_03325 [Planctomycetales bacterium]|nr:hypothetical protein [Planctomycetales bacterium]